MNRIIIKPIKGYDSLSGFKLGEEHFRLFAEDSFNTDDCICIVLDPSIKRIGISYVQGFINVIAKKYGISHVKEHLIIEASNEQLKQKFRDSINLYTYK